MATAGKGQNKSAFLRELFGKDPDLKLEEATGAWQKAGNEGEVGSSLFYNVKRSVGEKAGGTGDGGTTAAEPRPKAAAKGPKAKKASQSVVEARSESNGEIAPSTPATKSKTGDRERVLVRVEDGIDDLIVELKQLGGMEEALEALRKVRRVVVRSHEG